MRLILNIIAFQISWFACVLGAAHGMPWLGMLVTLVAVLLHTRLQANKRNTLISIVCVTLLGSLLDQSLLSFGLSHFPAHDIHPLLLPSWMYALWLAFATTLNVSLKWMQDKPMLAVGFGVVGGPLAYLSASKLGAITFTTPMVSYAVLALGWGLLTPLLLKLAKSLLQDTPSQPAMALSPQDNAVNNASNAS